MAPARHRPRLVERALDVAQSAGATSADLRVRSDEPGGEAFCRAIDFSLVRVWQRMWLEPLRVPAFTFPAGYSSRCFRPHADEALYADIVNDTMADHWGTGPVTAERAAHMVSLPDFDPTIHLLATCAGEIVGVCSARLVRRAAGVRELTTAHLGPIGVRAAHRGRGLARALIAACLRQCRQRRVEAAELDVDAENAAAIHVYRDCGMAMRFRILWYRRELS